jgi:hypothetical protein
MHRQLAIVSLDAVGSLVAAHPAPPSAGLFTLGSEDQSRELESAIVSLLEAHCEWFVCFGPDSEALHDRIDEIVAASGVSEDQTVLTTWHDDETAADVADFFFDVAGAREGSLMVVVSGQHDHDLAAHDCHSRFGSDLRDLSGDRRNQPASRIVFLGCRSDRVGPERDCALQLAGIVRDFSATDETVPANLRGTFSAFTQKRSDGMKHLALLGLAVLVSLFGARFRAAGTRP